MQPSSAFDILKQLTNAGKWKIIDHKLISNDAEPETSVSANIVVTPLSDLNRNRTDTKELSTSEALVVRKLKNKAVEMDAAVVGDFDDALNVNKENVSVECVNVIDGSVTTDQPHYECAAKHDLLTDECQDRAAETVDESDVCDGCDTAAVKLLQFPKLHRETFSLGTAVPMCSAVQLPVQSDSLDMVNLIGEVADICQRSVDDTEDISTQEVEAHKDMLDGFKQQHSAAGFDDHVLPVSKCTVHGARLQSVKDIIQQTDLILDPTPPATVVSADPCHMAHCLSVSECVSVNALKVHDVPHSSDSSLVLPSRTDRDVASVNAEQVPLAAVTVDERVEALAEASQHCDGGTDSVYTRSAVAEKLCETRGSYSEELLSSQVSDGNDSSDEDSESGESLAAKPTLSL